ncbi:MAG: hypothetical protein DRI73_04815 [Bacteroidetes bacterium]|nr:MAG: hypothetical protein DRI73_04815 [Bacteroidota bacterium]
MSWEIHNTYRYLQDSIPTVKQDSLPKADSIIDVTRSESDTSLSQIPISDSTTSVKKDSLSEVDSIPVIEKIQTKKADSTKKQQARTKQYKTIVEEIPQTLQLDSNHILLAYDTVPYVPGFDFFDNIEIKKVPELSKKVDFFIHEGEGSSSLLSDKNEDTIATIIEKQAFLKPEHKLNKDFQSQIWLIVPFLLILIQLARVKYYYGKLINPIIVSIFNYQTANNLYRNRNSFFQRASFALNLIFFFSGGLFLYQISTLYDFNILNYSPIINFLILTAVVSIWFFIKFITIHLIGYFSLSENMLNEYFFNISLHINTLGLLLIPITILASYAHYPYNNIFIYIGLGLVVLFYLARSFRLFVIFYTKRTLILYGILYLCALEILPLLVMVKILSLMS